jgi:hypothetical protein
MSVFSVSGDFLTQTARDLVLSEEYDRAMNFLSQSLSGISLEQVTEVLSGASRLTGVNDIGLEEDPDAAGYQKQLAYIYAGRQRIRHGGSYTWWKPVAHWRWTATAVAETNYLAYVDGESHTLREVRENTRSFRCKWVEAQGANAGEIVRAIPWSEGFADMLDEPEWALTSAGKQVLVFYAPCDAPPPWMLPEALRRSPFEAFMEALKVRRITVREWDARAYEPLESQLPEYVETEEPPQEKPRNEPWPIWDGKALPAKRFHFQMPDVQTAMDMLRQVRSEERIEHAREQIQKQADDTGWMEFPWGDRQLRVPKGAFECWALRRTLYAEDATFWKVLSGESWKQLGDDPYHTDWMLGAGLDLEQWDDTSLRDAAYAAMGEVQQRVRNSPSEEYTGTILVPLIEPVTGLVVHPKPEEAWYTGGPCQIVVLPNLSPRYAKAFTGAALVIGETGGAMAHMSQLGRSRGVPILRFEDARKAFPEGSWLKIEASGQITVLERT